MAKRAKWHIPDWMKKYEPLFCNTGGNTVEDLMNRDPREANVVINAPVALLCVAVQSQVTLLHQLRKEGKLA